MPTPELDQPTHDHDRSSRREFLGAAGASVVTLLLPVPAAAADEPAIDIAGIPVRLFVSAVSERTIRVSLLDARSKLTPATAFRSKGLHPARPLSAVEHSFTALTAPFTLKTKSLQVTLGGSPLTITLEHVSAGLRHSFTWNALNGEISFPLGDKPVFGLGEGGRQYDRRGAQDTLENGQNKPALFTTGGRNPIPFLISSAGWSVFYHHPLVACDLRKDPGVLRTEEPSVPQDIFFSLDSDPANLLREFATLTGLPHLPPMWALGFHQSHRTLSSAQEPLAEAQTFRQKRLPCDSLIYLGTGYAPSGWNTGHGSFGWNPTIFPNPQQTISQLHAEHFHVTVHVLDPPQDLHGSLTDAPVGDPDHVRNYWPQHLPVMQEGVDGWWVDDGDELPAEGRLARNRLYWDGPRQVRPDVRPFALHRNSYAGSAQYGWLWSGDINSQWETLRLQVAVGINTSLSGLPWWGTDTGGFFSTPELTAELYVRWFQLSAFSTLFRAHGRTWQLRRPWGWDTGEYGPVEDALDHLPAKAELHHAEVEGICRKYLNLRYQLMPYTYSLAWECHTTGLPVVRPMWLYAVADVQACAVADQYLWGRDLLVAPVVKLGATMRQVYLPKGRWYDFWTGRSLGEGGRTIEHAAALDTLPLLVRAGAIVTMGPVKQYAGEPSAEPLDVVVYPGADGSFTLYEDDGVSFGYERGVRSRMEMRWHDASGSFSVSLAEGDRMQPFTTTRLRVRTVNADEAAPISFNGKLVRVQL